MAQIVKAGLIQLANKIPTEEPCEKHRNAMIEAHIPYIEKAGKDGVQMLCFQEIFTGPYFCPSQDKKWYGLAEEIPGTDNGIEKHPDHEGDTGDDRGVGPAIGRELPFAPAVSCRNKRFGPGWSRRSHSHSRAIQSLSVRQISSRQIGTSRSTLSCSRAWPRSPPGGRSPCRPGRWR